MILQEVQSNDNSWVVWVIHSLVQCKKRGEGGPLFLVGCVSISFFVYFFAIPGGSHSLLAVRNLFQAATPSLYVFYQGSRAKSDFLEGMKTLPQN